MSCFIRLHAVPPPDVVARLLAGEPRQTFDQHLDFRQGAETPGHHRGRVPVRNKLTQSAIPFLQASGRERMALSTWLIPALRQTGTP